MLSYLTFFLLFILPLVILPFGASFFETPKVVLAEVVIEVMLFWVIIKGRFSLGRYPVRLVVWVGVIILLTLIHLIFLRTPVTFFGNVFRLQGMFLLWNLLVLGLLSTQIDIHRLFGWVLLPYLLLIMSAFILGGSEEGRLIGTLGEPNALAGMAIFFWPIIFLTLPKLPLRVLVFLAALMLVFLSGSRSGLIALGLEVVFLGLMKTHRIALTKAVIVCLLVLGIAYIMPFVEGGGVYENRAEIWPAALVAGAQYPIFGGGFGNIEKVFPKGSEILKNNARFQYVDSGHNLFLDWWMQGGLVGLGLLLALLWIVFKNLISESKIREVTLLLGLLAVMSFNPVSVVTLVQFWWLIGQGLKKPDI